MKDRDYFKLPSPPELVYELITLAADPNASFTQVAGVVSYDPPASAALIVLANSAFFAAPRPVRDLPSAIRTIGIDVSIAASLGAMLANTIGRIGHTKKAYRTAWYEGVLRGAIARKIAAAVAPSLSGQAYLVGLFSDLGVLALLANAKGYEKILSEYGSCRARLCLAEKKHLGVTHRKALLAICDNWKLPDAIRAPIIQEVRPVQSLVAIDGIVLCQIAWVVQGTPMLQTAGIERVSHDLDSFRAECLKLSSDDFDGILRAAGAEVSTTKSVLGKSIPRKCDGRTDLDVLQNSIAEARATAEWIEHEPLFVIASDTEQRQLIVRMLERLGARWVRCATSMSQVREESARILIAQDSHTELEMPPTLQRVQLNAPLLVLPSFADFAAETRTMRSPVMSEMALWHSLHEVRMTHFTVIS